MEFLLSSWLVGWLWGVDGDDEDIPWWGWLLWIVVLTAAVASLLWVFASSGILREARDTMVAYLRELRATLGEIVKALPIIGDFLS